MIRLPKTGPPEAGHRPVRTGALIAVFAAALAALAPAGTPRGGRRPAAAAAPRQAVLDLLASGPPWSRGRIDAAVDRLLAGAQRVSGRPSLRSVLPALSAACPPAAPFDAREVLLYAITEKTDNEFDDVEALQYAWGVVPRRSADRRVRLAAGGARFAADDRDPVEATIYSFPSSSFEPGEVERLLEAVRRAHPKRPIVALVDPLMRIQLADFARGSAITLLDTFGWPYSPWPRDSFSQTRDSRGRMVLLARPKAALLRARAADDAMAREIVKDAPEELMRRWGEPVWALAPVPFHNGQLLTAAGAAWISLHSLEPRILEILHASRVPVESFANAEGIARYCAAARRAAAELGVLYGRTIRFVHRLPESGTLGQRRELMTAIGGGAGFDLDSIVTIAGGGAGRGTAIVADPSRGKDLVAGSPAPDLSAFADLYGLSLRGDDLRRALLSYQEQPRTLRLGTFLDLVDRHLREAGFSVRRLPAFLVPVALRREPVAGEDDFLIGWNNVVLDRDGEKLRAEGFSGGLASGDALARRAFSDAGWELSLYPPLVPSVVRNGGYRCASNNFRLLPK